MEDRNTLARFQLGLQSLETLGFSLNLKHEGNAGFKSGEGTFGLLLMDRVKQLFGVS